MTLKIPLECYNALLSSSTLFPRLTELSLHIFASDYSTNPVDPMCTDLAPFINRHVHSLESLTVITPETGTADLSPMFFNLRFFPRLTKLHLIFCALSLEYINLTGIHEFFSAHCNQLQDLLLHFNRMVGLKPQTFLSETFFQLPVFRVPLPVLESLDVGFTGFRDSSGQGTITYVHQFRGNLKRVLLNHTQLSIGNVTRLTDGFWNLRYLEIFVYHLNPALLDLLSSRLTQLVDLRVTCICFSGSQGPFLCADDPARAHKWCAEMSQRLYSGWSLRHIRLDILSDTAKNLALCKRALASALPDVETIDGVGRSEVLGLHAEGGMALSHHVNRWIFSIYEAEQE
ncbi:hypothetical protein CC2G_003838 [Coprinopsis cinerea AmutBmut pab1-1]|nr:hypothetical protein CC2G_003838 [Coprinopsis cinerea AmutBmut pab1-1]